MRELKTFTIPFVGLKLGKHQFEYKIDKKFFDFFEYQDFNDAVNVNCDLTNEPYNQEISNNFDLVVKFGEDYNDEEIDLLVLPHGEYEVNVQQYIYEIIILTVPSKLIHPGVEDGTLQSDILEKLEELSPKEKQEKEDNEDIDPRWNTLKKLLTDK